VAVAGATGRMGGRVARAVEADPAFSLVATPGRGGAGIDWKGARAVADFTSPAGTATLAPQAAADGVALLVGTTGLDGPALEAVDAAARRVAVLVAPNLSPGVAALTRALRAALAALPGYDVEIVERHHRAKVDAPSGTALALARTVADERGWPWPGALRVGRSGPAGPRPDAEVGVHAVRGGSWVGEHAVLLAGPHETVELTHVAHDRDAFAAGALVALRFLAGAKPGRYTLEDALA
jgi:4-hydroxy-tetrahydrodipicolinate reductase